CSDLAPTRPAPLHTSRTRLVGGWRLPAILLKICRSVSVSGKAYAAFQTVNQVCRVLMSSAAPSRRLSANTRSIGNSAVMTVLAEDVRERWRNVLGNPVDANLVSDAD